MFRFMPTKAERLTLPASVATMGRSVALASAAAAAGAGGGRLRPQHRGPGRPAGLRWSSAIGAENEYANVLSQIGGRYVHVSSILNNPNTDPHTFEASPQVAQEVSAAQLIVQNGVGYDTWMSKIESASPNPKRKVIVVQHVLGLPDSTPNPHLWYSPATMPAVAKAMAADLSALQPAHAAYFRANLTAFDRSLAPWLTAIAAVQGQVPGHHGGRDDRAGRRLPADGHGDQQPHPVHVPGRHHERRRPAHRRTSPWRTASSPSTRSRSSPTTSRWSTALTTSIRQTALKAGVPVVGVYETMPTGYDYQSWMLAEVQAIQKAVASKISTQKL